MSSQSELQVPGINRIAVNTMGEQFADNESVSAFLFGDKAVDVYFEDHHEANGYHHSTICFKLN